MRVAVLGAGVAGLTVAHELVERGVEVDIFDRLPIAGGKARSVVIELPGQEGWPGEHGFHFFASFYRHVIHTMERIPLPDGATVVDNLIDAPTDMLSQAKHRPIETPTIGPMGLSEFVTRLRAFLQLDRVVTATDLAFFIGKLWQVMTSCSERRLAEYENVSWDDFIDASDRSDQYRLWFAGAATKTLIAASGKRASSRTVGDIMVQLAIGGWLPGLPSDRLLNGPTNDAWITPWVEYLEGTGRVTFHRDHAVTRIDFDGPRVTGVEIESDGTSQTVTADAYVSAMPVEVVAKLVPDATAELAPTLGQVRLLANDVAWMAGIQIFLRRDTRIVAGHAIYVGSPWGLTSVSEQQFWKNIDLGRLSDGRVHGVVSIDISDWDQVGFNGKTARECTPEEISEEVLEQMRACLDEATGIDLAPENIDSFFIDPDIVFFGEDGTAEANHEPLLVNTLGSWWTRPNAYTEIDNLFLAGDYVKTYTDLATMEGANESGRRAVNALIRAGKVSGPLCRLWKLHEPAILAPLRWRDTYRFTRGKTWSSDVPELLLLITRLVVWFEGVRHRLERKRADR